MADGKRLTRKELKQDEIMEAAKDFGDWFEEHWRTVAMWAAGGLAVIVGAIAFSSWGNARSERASADFSEAQRRYLVVVEGGETEDTFESLATRFGEIAGTASGEMESIARYYQGMCELRGGDPAKASATLAPVAETDGQIADAARVGLAHAQAGSGDVDTAESTLRDLATRSYAFPPDQALLTLARLLEDNGHGDRAEGVYREITTDHPTTPSAGTARAALGF